MERSASPRGRGRPPGSRNKRTIETQERVAASGMTPLDYLTSVYQDEGEETSRRIDAAKAAAPYCHARLQPVDKDGDTEQKVRVQGALQWQPPQ
jgi:hypothetical protein